MAKLTIAGATLNQTPIDWANNRSNILSVIQEAQSQNVDLLCLPELCITGYGCEDLFLSEWLHERAMFELLEIVPHCEGIAVAIGLPIHINGKTYNCCAMINDGEIQGFYAKQHLAKDGVHYETRWFTAWEKEIVSELIFEGNSYAIGDVTFDNNHVKIGFEICEDAWRADRPAYRLIEKGVDIILNPSASHFAFEKTKSRQDLVINSSKEFNCTYVYANLLGNEAGRMIYDGEILIAQNGKLLAKNKHLTFLPYQLSKATVDFAKAESSPESISEDFTKNEEFERASALALYDYLRKSKSKGFVLSLSGGADSACCAVLVASMVKYGIRTFGADNFLLNLRQGELIEQLPDKNQSQFIISKFLTCVYQSSENSGFITRNAAETLAKSIGATFHEWSIQDEVSSYSEKISTALKRDLGWEQDDIALQNIQARARSPIVWMLANINNALLLTTSNRSEGDVGYTTMDGDTSGSIAPIAAVDKPFIRQWLKWAEGTLKYDGLAGVNAQDPTAELRPSDNQQTDEDDLMPYDIMLAIEKLAIGQHRSPVEVFHQLSNEKLSSKTNLKKYIAKFYRLWSINQWKRERIAPSFHLDDYNVDPKTWCRFPILSGSYQEEIKEMLLL